MGRCLIIVLKTVENKCSNPILYVALNIMYLDIRFIGPKTWNDIDESIKSLSESYFFFNLKQQLIDYHIFTMCMSQFFLLCFVLC